MKCLLTSAHFDVNFCLCSLFHSFLSIAIIWRNWKIYFNRSMNSNRFLSPFGKSISHASRTENVRTFPHVWLFRNKLHSMWQNVFLHGKSKRSNFVFSKHWEQSIRPFCKWTVNSEHSSFPPILLRQEGTAFYDKSLGCLSWFNCKIHGRWVRSGSVRLWVFFQHIFHINWKVKKG